jgi:hypothetical protein
MILESLAEARPLQSTNQLHCQVHTKIWFSLSTLFNIHMNDIECDLQPTLKTQFHDSFPFDSLAIGNKKYALLSDAS